MATVGQAIILLVLASLAGLTWWLPRRLGLLGMFAVQILVGVGFVGMGAIALATGVWDKYEGGETILGLLFEAVAFNVVLLPVAGVAVWRCCRATAKQELAQGSIPYCSICGYDLRASKERCPECGTAIPAGQGEVT
ncbi:MAG TPA: hypothetical protein VGI81_14095 [Tepidisphaeraceae bacterium]